MKELNSVAKRIHNISPEPVALTLDNGTEAVFHIASSEFFQEKFQAEGTRDNDEAQYRFVSSDDSESILVGRKRADEQTWSMVGIVLEVDREETG